MLISEISFRATHKKFDKNLKMKLSSVLSVLAVAHASDDDVVADDTWVGPNAEQTQVGIARKGDRAIDQERRYEDLAAIAKKYWQKNAPEGQRKFDERKLWAYGCHCHILGDRPMSQMGKGKPVDGLDRKCMAYKNCQKCVREVHGEECIGEVKQYTWKFATRTQSFVSENAVGTCERDLFNCDVQFVEDTFAQQGEWNTDFHLFWSTTGFDPTDGLSCQPGDGSEYVERVCKGGYEEPYVWTRKDPKQSTPNKYKPNNEKPNNDKPNKYKPNNDKPNNDKPNNDKPNNDKPNKNDKPNNDNKYKPNKNNDGY